MKTLDLKIQLSYDEMLWHGTDKESEECFISQIIKGKNLVLHDTHIGDAIGKVIVVDFIGKENESLERFKAELIKSSGGELLVEYQFLKDNEKHLKDNRIQLMRLELIKRGLPI